MSVQYLITGANGFLASRAAQALGKNGNVVALSRQELEITDAEACKRVVSHYQPRCVLQAAAIADMQACEADPHRSFEVNVQGAVNMAAACQALGVKLIHISTDQVYSGMLQDAPHRESEALAPASVYGRHKLEAEQRVTAIHPDAVLLRLTWMYDFPVRNLRTNRNLLRLCQQALFTGKPITFPSNTPRGITDVHEVIRNVPSMENAPGGIYNFGGAGDMTAYQAACEVFRCMQAEHRIPELLQPAQEEPGTLPNLCMDGNKADLAGAHFLTTGEGIRQVFQAYGLL